MKEPRRATIVAEIGCNHKGSLETAKEMITVAKIFCRVDIVKFQKRNPRGLLNPRRVRCSSPSAIPQLWSHLRRASRVLRVQR